MFGRDQKPSLRVTRAFHSMVGRKSFGIKGCRGVACYMFSCLGCIQLAKWQGSSKSQGPFLDVSQVGSLLEPPLQALWEVKESRLPSDEPGAVDQHAAAAVVVVGVFRYTVALVVIICFFFQFLLDFLILLSLLLSSFHFTSQPFKSYPDSCPTLTSL